MKRTFQPPSLATALRIDALLVIGAALVAWSALPSPDSRGNACAHELAARSRSPLEQSPGYHPPADPESLSVVTGRRNAPRVALRLTHGASSIRDLAQLILAGLQAKD